MQRLRERQYFFAWLVFSLLVGAVGAVISAVLRFGFDPAKVAAATSHLLGISIPSLGLYALYGLRVVGAIVSYGAFRLVVGKMIVGKAPVPAPHLTSAST